MESTTEQVWVLPRATTSPREARRRLEESCSEGAPERLEDARLLVTELVSNALLHGAGPVGLSLTRAAQRWRVGVEDESPAEPVVRQVSDDDESGRGMHLVARLATGWGVDSRADGLPGKRVWFEIT